MELGKCMTVLSVYAPIIKAPSKVKQMFIEDLQDVINAIPPSGILIVLGNFNARIQL